MPVQDPNTKASEDKEDKGTVDKSKNQSTFTVTDKGVNDTPTIKPKEEDFLKYLDMLSGTPEKRCHAPVTYYQRYLKDGAKEKYDHREVFSKYHLRIGDCCFVMPPESFSIKEVTETVRVPSIRKMSSMKKKSAYSYKDIAFTLYFNGDEQINGYPVNSPFKDVTYYVDGLRPFLAQCKLSPIMPIENEFLNDVNGVFSIAIQTVSINTVPGFPKLLKVDVVAVECCTTVYTQAPEFEFSNHIDWDLYRYNYQRLLSEIDIAKDKLGLNNPIPKEYKLKPVSNFKEEQSLDFQIVDITSIKPKDKEEMYLDFKKAKYTSIIDNKNNEFIVAGLNFGYSNIINNIQLSNYTKPAIQYLGGNDTTIGIQLTTTSKETVKVFSSLIEKLKQMTIKLRETSGTGFLKIDNPFLNMLGTNFLLVDDLIIETVPNFPNLYAITLSCYSYDTTSLMSESIRGFRPFEGDKKGTKGDCINQGYEGLLNKIKQDLIAEEKMCNGANLYPDLLLPEISELDKAITKINSYRRKVGVAQLPFSEFPTTEKITLTKGTSERKKKLKNKFADPDFYFMYPYQKFSTSNVNVSELVGGVDFANFSVNHTYESSYNDKDALSTAQNGGSGNLVDTSGTPSTISMGDKIKSPSSCDALHINVSGKLKTFIDTLLSQCGCKYIYGASANQTGSDGKRIFDCSSFVAFGLHAVGMFDNLRPCDTDIEAKFPKVSDSLKPGDLLCRPGQHIGVYIGNDLMVHAANPRDGVYYGRLGMFQPKQTMVCRPNFAPSDYSASSAETTNSAINSMGMSAYDMGLAKLQGGYNAIQNPADIVSSVNKYGDSTESQANSGEAKIGKFPNADNNKYDNLILSVCAKYQLDPNWVKAMIKQESDFQADMGPDGDGSVGLWQVSQPPCDQVHMPYDVGRLKNPTYNLEVGAKYFKYCLECCGGDYEYAVMGYNGGPENLGKRKRKGLGAINRVNQNHIDKVKGYYNQLMGNGGKSGFLTGLFGSLVGFSSSLFSGIFGIGAMRTKKVVKKHGSRTKEFTEGFGKPLLFMSPVNSILSGKYQKMEELEKKYPKEKIDDIVSSGGYENKNTASEISQMAGTEEEQSTLKTLEEKHKPILSGNYKEYTEAVKDGLDPNNDYYLTTMTVNDTVFNKRGTMLRAFPTYCVLISNDNTGWFDGRKLWNNYYPYKSVSSISVYHEKEQPVGTARIRVTNLSHNLSRYPNREETAKKSLSSDKEYSWLNRMLFKHFGTILGTAKVTEDVIASKNALFREMKLEAGARIHIRMGYGSNPDSLNIMFNGNVAEVSVGEELEIIAQSDGAELVNNVISTEKDAKNGLFKFSAEASNICASLLCDRCSISNIINKDWGEDSEYHIEHFGLFMRQSNQLNMNHEYDLCKNIYTATYNKQYMCQLSNWNPFEGEKNLYFFMYNKTPWDVVQLSANCLPEFICQPMYHQFETRLFLGLPTWNCKYRYSLSDEGEILEEAKSFQQVHIINGDDILDNKVKTTSKFLHTNVVPMYSLGGDMKAGPTMFADKSIDWSKQKTLVLDTIIQQDHFGPDKLYEWLGATNARENAISIGTATLINEYSKMYYDEIITLGKPGVRPLDYMFIEDPYSEMYGLCEVRGVTHTISPETGFVSNIQPGCIAYSKTYDSGSTNTYRTCANLCNVISSLLTARENCVDYANQGVSSYVRPIIAKDEDELHKLRRKIIDFEFCSETKADEYSKYLASVVHDATATFDKVKAKQRAELVANGVKYLWHFSPAGLLQGLICRISLIQACVDFFKYSNCIGIRPLLRKQMPFASATKGSEKLIDGYNQTPFDKDTESE